MPKSDETQEPPFSSDWTKSAYASSIGETASSGQSLSAPTRGGVIWPVTLALLAIEASGGLALLALFKKGDRTFSAFLPTSAGFVSMVAIAVLTGAIGYLFKVYSKTKPTGRREFHLTVVMNLMTVLVVTVSAEFAIRILATDTREGPAINGMLLLPKTWSQVRSHNLQLWERAAGDLSYQTYDPLLGWKVGSTRSSANGLYFSDHEGLRAARAGAPVDVTSDRHVVAVLGDSFTFGEEVAYEDAWPSQLEKLMGQDFKVLNFGVPGYGVDQTYLRYIHEASIRKPDVLIFAFINHDLLRSMMVYTFLNLPEWDWPFSKPRLIMTEAGLQPYNAPAIPPPAIFAKADVTELPYLDHDIGYFPSQWQGDFYQASYLVRFFLSRFPRWVPKNHNGDEEAVFALNGEILKAFLRRATEAGSKALIVYLPTAADLDSRPQELAVLGRSFLAKTGVPILDLTPCLSPVPVGERFTQEFGGHYSPRGNAAVAQCLSVEVQKLLASPSPSTNNRRA